MLDFCLKTRYNYIVKMNFEELSILEEVMHL